MHCVFSKSEQANPEATNHKSEILLSILNGNIVLFLVQSYISCDKMQQLVAEDSYFLELCPICLSSL